MRIHDAVAGLLLMVFGFAVIFYARTFPATAGQDIGPGFFPVLIGVGIAGCGATLLWSARRVRSMEWIEFEEWVRRPRMAGNGALVIGTLLFYAAVVDWAGFFVTAFLF